MSQRCEGTIKRTKFRADQHKLSTLKEIKTLNNIKDVVRNIILVYNYIMILFKFF